MTPGMMRTTSRKTLSQRAMVKAMRPATYASLAPKAYGARKATGSAEFAVINGTMVRIVKGEV